MNKTTVHNALLRDDANRRLVAYAAYEAAVARRTAAYKQNEAREVAFSAALAIHNADINAASVAYNTTLAPSPNDATRKKTYDNTRARRVEASIEYENADATYTLAYAAATDIHNAALAVNAAYFAVACDDILEATYIKATADRAADDAYEATGAIASAVHDTFKDAYEKACQEFYDASYAIYEAKMKKVNVNKATEVIELATDFSKTYQSAISLALFNYKTAARVRADANATYEATKAVNLDAAEAILAAAILECDTACKTYEVAYNDAKTNYKDAKTNYAIAEAAIVTYELALERFQSMKDQNDRIWD